MKWASSILSLIHIWIISQKAVYIEDGDTPETLQRRVMEQAEWILLPAAAEKVAGEIAEKGESYGHL